MDPKSRRLTPSEQLVADLCDRAFMRQWAHPSPVMLDKQNKELCDCLVVLGKDVIIFSVKDCAYKGPKLDDQEEGLAPEDVGARLDDFDVQSKRWTKKAITDSAGQIYSAVRYLQRGARVSTREGKPITLPSFDQMKIHRVAVALGSGDLSILDLSGPESVPLLVLTEADLVTVLTHLDTVPDFIDFHRWACEDLRRSRLYLSDGAFADLLALYLKGVKLEDQDAIAVASPVWETFRQGPEYEAWVEAMKPSYLWDQLLNLLVGSLLVGSLKDGSTGDAITSGETPAVIEAMLRERRRVRAQLGSLIAKELGQPPRFITHAVRGEVNDYVLIVGAYDHREVRTLELECRCRIVAANAGGVRPVVGVAMDHPGSQTDNIEAVYVDVPLGEDERGQALELQSKFGFFRGHDWRAWR